MENPELGYDDVRLWILSHANEQECDALSDAIHIRTKNLVAQTTCMLKVGQSVVITKISPKYIEGMTGVLEKVERRPRSTKEICSIRLDRLSTMRLRRASLGDIRVSIPKDTEEYLLDGIPMACIRPT